MGLEIRFTLCFTEIADKISKGDIEQKIDINSKDEVGQLAKSFSMMLTNLSQAIYDRDQSIDSFRQVEKALLLERNNFRNILESMEDGIYIVNQQYDIQYVNPVLKKDFGIYADRKCYEYFHDRTKVCPWCKSNDVFKGKTVRWEWYSFKNQKTYDLIDTPLKNSDGSISKLEMFRDITEYKQAEEELTKYRKHLEELVKERTKELEEKNKELERFNKLFVGREFRIKELKDKIKKLEK